MTTQNESPLTFPCDFPIKVFGEATETFPPLVLELIRKHLPDVEESALRTRKSQDGKYESVTVLVHVNSRETLDAIYRELTSHHLILMAL